MGIKKSFAPKVPARIEDVQKVRLKYGVEFLGTCRVTQARGGMKCIRAMTYKMSGLDSQEINRFRGYTIHDCHELLLMSRGRSEPFPESHFGLLMAGDVFNVYQVNFLRASKIRRPQRPRRHVARLPPYVAVLRRLSCLAGRLRHGEGVLQ